MSDQVAEAAIELGKPIISNAVQSTLRLAGKRLLDLGRKFSDQIATEIEKGFEDYLAVSYYKCRYYKTLISPNVPIEVTRNYVNIRLRLGSKKILDTDFICNHKKYKYMVVTGLAGSGKSMLMKYMTVHHIENKTGILPLFIELRQLNGLQNRDLISFARSACCGDQKRFSTERFKLALQSGAFLLILDGFDELDHDHRDEVQAQILDLGRNYPDLPIIVSSRPDDRFRSWATFYTFQVDALSKQQSLKLIASLDYKEGVKKRFAKEVKTKLYKSHPSFLSSPLLTTIMLLTYEEYAEIPSKMHSFYGQAFDTLLQKHDAGKEQFKRKTKTGLVRDDFKFCFSVFCAITYLESKFSFTEDEVVKSAQQALEYARDTRQAAFENIKPTDLVCDLKEAVCMLQQDGLDMTFVHRSFQEYFSAVFVSGLSGSKVRSVLDRFAMRPTDSVIMMAHDIARELIELEWVLPNLDRLTVELRLSRTGTSSLASSISKLSGNIHYFEYKNHRSIEFFGPQEHYFLAYAIFKIYAPELIENLLHKTFMISLSRVQWNNICRDKPMNLPRRKDFDIFFEAGKREEPKPELKARKIVKSDEWWLVELGFKRVFKELRDVFSKIHSDIKYRERRRSHILEKLFET